MIIIAIIAAERWGTAAASSPIAAPVGFDNRMDLGFDEENVELLLLRRGVQHDRNSSLPDPNPRGHSMTFLVECSSS